MKHLIVYSHPNPKSFCHAILETVAEELQRKGHKAVLRDLYALGFDPVLKSSDFAGFQSGSIPQDIKTEQEHISRAEVLILIYPIWWSGLPAMAKGYVDRVFSLGFAYAFEETGGAVGLLKGKRVVIFNTQGTPREQYEALGMYGAMTKTCDAGVFQFCGMEVANHTFFPSVPFVDDATRRGYLAEVKAVISRL